MGGGKNISLILGYQFFIMKNYIFCILLLTASYFDLLAQNKEITELVRQEVFTMPNDGIRDTRAFLDNQKNKFNPINILSASLLYFYQNLVSEQLSGSCSFEISCSEYTKKSIEKLGWFRGVFLGLNQYTNCVPRNHEHHAACAVNQDMKIVNHIGRE